MIPQEFFDWVAGQWWGYPAFILITLTGLILFSWGLAIGGRNK